MSSHPPVPAAKPERQRSDLPAGIETGSWLDRQVELEESDLPGKVAIGASCLAVAFSLGELVSDAGIFGLFPVGYGPLLGYGSSLLAGCIIAGGFLSRARTARYTAIVATVATASFYFIPRLGLPGALQETVRVGYGVALLAGIAVWALRALKRRTAPKSL